LERVRTEQERFRQRRGKAGLTDFEETIFEQMLLQVDRHLSVSTRGLSGVTFALTDGADRTGGTGRPMVYTAVGRQKMRRDHQRINAAPDCYFSTDDRGVLGVRSMETGFFGRVEQWETIQQGAAREAFEESRGVLTGKARHSTMALRPHQYNVLMS